MITLKEGLLNKKNIKDIIVNDTVYVVYNPFGDIEIENILDKMPETEKVITRNEFGKVEVFVLYEAHLKNVLSKIKDVNRNLIILKAKKFKTIKETSNFLKKTEFKYNTMKDEFIINHDDLISEGLLNKKNIKDVNSNIFYIIFPFKDDQMWLNKHVSEDRIRPFNGIGWSFYIVSEDKLKKEAESLSKYISSLCELTSVWRSDLPLEKIKEKLKKSDIDNYTDVFTICKKLNKIFKSIKEKEL